MRWAGAGEEKGSTSAELVEDHSRWGAGCMPAVLALATWRSRSRLQVAERALARLSGFGYCQACAGDAASTLLRRRFQEIV
jgi:hypothetical protein